MQTATLNAKKSGHAAVNGGNYYYAVYGTGEPLLLLHGGLGQIEMFGPNLTKLAQDRQVIGVDLQGHGRTHQQADQPVILNLRRQRHEAAPRVGPSR
jgi:pimeloyl-ACP methyl ester carboxylesterase